MIHINTLDKDADKKAKELIEEFAYEHPDYPIIDNITFNFFGKRLAIVHVEGILKANSIVYNEEIRENGVMFDLFWKKVLEKLKK